MDKIVGKFFLYMVLACVNTCYAATLQIKSLEGTPITQVAVGYPFNVVVTAENERGLSMPNIPGLNQFHVLRRVVSETSINDKEKRSFTYQLRAKEPGSYTFGPVTMKTRSGVVQSDKVKLSVTAKPPEDNIVSDETDSAVFARLVTDAERPVVGQKVTIQLHVYIQDDAISIAEPSNIDIDGAQVHRLKDYLVHNVTVNEVPYKRFTFTWHVYPTKPGDLVIPAHQVNAYEEDTSGFFSFFSRRRTISQRLYSNAITLSVRSLPPCGKPVYAVGAFDSFNATVEPAVARNGEGIVLTLSLHGDGNFINVQSIPLHEIPKELRWYDSKSYKKSAQGGNLPHCCFEYILQGLKECSVSVPPQQFTFYDTRVNAYKTLSTHEIPIQVVGSSLGQEEVEIDTNELQESTHENKTIFVDTELVPIDTYGVWYPQKKRVLPWWLFWLLFFVPIVLVMVDYWRGWWTVRSSCTNYKRRYRNAFTNARKKFVHIEKEKDATKLYPLFVQMFADCMKTDKADVSQESIANFLRLSRLPTETINQWNQFFVLLASSSFSNDSQETYTLFVRAKQWLQTFERVL